MDYTYMGQPCSKEYYKQLTVEAENKQLREALELISKGRHVLSPQYIAEQALMQLRDVHPEKDAP